MDNLPFAEDLNYWKTSRASADDWLEKAERLIEDYGGEVVARATGRAEGCEAIMMRFRFGTELFHARWPVLPSETGDTKSARRQAATMVYHDVKSRAVRFRIFGARHAFFEYLCLPDGRAMMDLSTPELASSMPKLLAE